MAVFHSELSRGVRIERAAETTPGNARSCAPMRSYVSVYLDGGILAVNRFTLTSRTRSGSNPISAVARLRKLRRSNPAVTRSTSESATCDATIHRRRRARDPPAAAGFSLIVLVSEPLVPRSAGAAPNSRPVMVAAPAVKMRTRASKAKSRTTCRCTPER